MTKYNSRRSFGKNPDYRPRRKTPSLQERRDAGLRAQKRMFKSMGLIGDKYPFQWKWSLDEHSGIVEAFTKGEARARIKEVLSIPKKKKLSKFTIIERIEVSE